ncbi:MAG: hypothetical protein Q9182_006263 [Xanthomendoza sp. 2 TL-2023]
MAPPTTRRERVFFDWHQWKDLEVSTTLRSLLSAVLTTSSNMPSAVTPQRRSRENSSDREGSPLSDDSQSASKRARFNLNGFAARTSQSPILRNGYGTDGSAQQEVLRTTGPSQIKHQPGSIVRVKLAHFVTYTAVEFLPGPSLNMVIGPNGTGKSTLVCAICLGLGWGPQHLGRAKDVSEYVKHGEQEATIEIELARDPRRHRRNPVIRCNIKRENNKCTFSIDGNVSNKKTVIELCRSFAIQIDNLCQFLPQDKVVEFAAMTPVELLRSTQRAVAPQEMLDMHDELKDHRQKQKGIQAKAQAEQDALNNLENRQRMQADDVQRMRDREVIKERVRVLQASRPLVAYRAVKQRHAEAKERKKHVANELEKLKQDVEPSLRAVNDKKDYQRQVGAMTNGRRKAIQDAEKAADGIHRKLEALLGRKSELEAEREAEVNAGKETRRDIPRLQGNIAALKRRIDEEQPDLDISGYNEQIRGKQRAIDEAIEKVSDLQRKQQDLKFRGQERNQRIDQAQRNLENLESQAGQQETKLKAISRDTSAAWDWIKTHQDEFEKPVYGPPIVECSVTDLRYVDQIEALIQRSQLTITCQTQNDFKKLGNFLHGELRLSEINMQHMPGTLADFSPPIERDQLGRYGLIGWALDYITGPEPVMAMLCASARLERTGLGDRDTTSEQFELLENGPIENWVTKRCSYKVVRRREYGPSATSTSVRDIRKAHIWTNQPVDMMAKRDLQENIEGWTGEVDEFKAEVDAAQAEIVQLRTAIRETKEEIGQLQTEKASKQKMLSELRALPTKLAQQEERLAAAQQSIAEMRQRMEQIREKQDIVTRERAEAALDYVVALEALQARHHEVHEAEIMSIEAASDLATLEEKNASVTALLDVKCRESEQAIAEFERQAKAGKEILKAVAEMRDKAERSGDAALLNQIQHSPAEQTSQQLEEEIESEKARLELMHEGNDRGIIKEYEAREQKIGNLRTSLENMRDELEQAGERVQGLRERWEPELDRLVGLISRSFGENMKEIGCAGEVGVGKDDDFENWSIKILVKFRESEPLTPLDSHRQSGGERAVSTIFYLMSLQSLTRSPFRVVDEINQGMDPRNERLVHRRMVGIACSGDVLLDDASSSRANGITAQSFDSVTVSGDGEGDDVHVSSANGRATVPQSQYFLITPKLLPSLTYARGMRVLCIASGEHMPEKADQVDFRGCVDLARGLRATLAVR